MPYRVFVNKKDCIACSLAWTACPEVFEQDLKTGKNHIRPEYLEEETEIISVGLIPEELYECVRIAADGCPTQAIRIEKVEEDIDHN
jgi:ferredoxin